MTGLLLPLTLSLSPLCPPPTLTQTHSRHNRWSWSLNNAGTDKLVMNTSSILMAWESAGRCQAPLKRNMDFHFKQALLRTRVGSESGGGQMRPPHTWQGPAWAAVQCLFTVSDSNRDPLKDKRSCVSQPGQLASGWSAVLFNDPHRGQGKRTWGDTQEIPGFVSKPNVGELAHSLG